MAYRDGASSVQGNAIRITRLQLDGAIDPRFPVLTTRGFITASFSPEYEEGDEITEKRADGGVCISWKADDTLKRLNFNLSLCSPDPEAAALLAGGQVICDAEGLVVGYTSPEVGSIAGNPVAIEIWSTANVGGKPAAGAPFWHWAFPYVKVRYDGDREFGNSALANEFSGQALGNPALVTNGLNPNNAGDDFVTYKEALVNPFSYVRSTTLPPFGWKEGESGGGSGFPTDPEFTLGECAITEAAAASVGDAPTAGPAGAEPNGELLVDSATGDVWIVRARNWVDSGVSLAPIPAAVAIVASDPTATPPTGTFADDDVVWWNDGTTSYKAYRRTAGAWVAESASDIIK